MKKRNNVKPEDVCRSGLRFCEQTNYPAIFNKVYWGAFKEPCEIEILRNRNEFVREFKIKASRPHFLVYDRSLDAFDHVENYITEKGEYVMIISPYAKSDNSPYLQEAIDLGFKVHKKLYGPDATTLIQTFQTKADLKAFGVRYAETTKRKR